MCSPTVYNKSNELLKGRLFQILAVFLGTVSVIADGMQYGWSAPIIPILRSQNSPVAIAKSDVVWLENIYMIGAFAGLPITIYLVDKIGRKKSMMVAAVQNLLGWVLISVAGSVEVLYVARLLTGLASNVAFVSTPMYIAEIADEKIRGFLCCFTYIMMLIGVLIIYAVGPFVSITISSIVGASFLVFQLVTFIFMPESPYYYLLKDQDSDALISLQRLRCRKNVEKEFEEISETISRQESEKGRLIDLVLVDSNRKATLILMVLNAAQHFSGISVILMNIHSILADAASILSASTASLIFAVVMLVAACIAACLVDKFGRKSLLTSSSCLTSLSLFLIGTYFAVKNAGIDVASYNWVPVAALMLYGAAFKIGLGLVPSVLTGELFPTNVKAKGMTLGDGSYVLFAALSIYLYQVLENAYGEHIPFFIFAICCLLTTLFIVFYIPETKGKTLDEIQTILKGGSGDYRNIQVVVD